MKRPSLFLILLVLPGLLGFAPSPVEPAANVHQIAIDSTISAYGYTMTSEATSWVGIDLPENDITAEFTNRDDGIVEEKPIGFDFWFHGVKYSQINVSINGILLFDQTADRLYDPVKIPFDGAPNNYIAPLWDDLTLGEIDSGLAVYYHTDLTASPKRLTVEWHVINRSSFEALPLVFQAVLDETGDIRFNYYQLDGEVDRATVGLEDARGLDGIQYRSEKTPAPLDTSTGILFTYPSDNPHLSGRSTSHYLGGFLNNYTLTYPLPIENTGNAPATFSLWMELAAARGDPGQWEVQLLGSDQRTPLPTSNGKSITPAIGPNTTYTAYIRVTAPSETPIGDYLFHILRIAPSMELGRIFSIDIRTAVPTPFAQGFVDSGLGVMLQFSRPAKVDLLKAVDYFSGSTMTLGETSRYGILFAWERQQQFHSNIEYVFASSMGSFTNAPRVLQNNSGFVKDELPKMTTTQNGRVGFITVRGDYVAPENPVYELVFSILDRSGQVLVPPFGLTGNTQGTNDGGIIIGGAPTLATTSANQFLLSWAQGHYLADDQVDDLFLALYDDNGVAIQPGVPLTNSQVEGVRYMEPDLAELGNDQYLLAYTRYDEVSGLNIAARVIDTSGNTVVGETLLPGAAGQRPETVVLNDNRILISWTNLETRQISYALLNADLSMAVGPVDLPSVTGLDMDHVSASRDANGNAILTWGDWHHRALYYALISSEGEQITPAMVFRKASDPDWPMIYISQTGESNISLTGTSIHRYYIPLSMHR